MTFEDWYMLSVSQKIYNEQTPEKLLYISRNINREYTSRTEKLLA